MPHFEPFRGVRYDLSHSPVADVTAPPYDVIDPDDRVALVARHPHNVVVIDLPDEADGPDRYTAAARTFGAWQTDGTLLRDEVPTYYAYRMGYRDDLGRPAHTLGVVGALELSRPGEGGILPHERTTPKAKSDRLDLLRATRANLSSVWGLSLTSGLTDLCRVDEAPDADWTDDDGVEHTLWRITDPDRVAAISAAVASSPVVIADGHHRYETSLAYRDERREAEGTGGGADLVMVYVVELVDDELTVRPIHRLLADLPDDFDLEAALAPFFDVSDDGVADAMVLTRMAEAGALAAGPPRRLRGPAAPPPRGHGRRRRPRLGAARRGPRRAAGPHAHLPARGRPRRQGRRERPRAVRRAAAAGHGRPDRRQRPRRRADAAEDHLLPPQAPHGRGLPPHRLRPDPARHPDPVRHRDPVRLLGTDSAPGAHIRPQNALGGGGEVVIE